MDLFLSRLEQRSGQTRSHGITVGHSQQEPAATTRRMLRETGSQHSNSNSLGNITKLVLRNNTAWAYLPRQPRQNQNLGTVEIWLGRFKISNLQSEACQIAANYLPPRGGFNVRVKNLQHSQITR